MLPPCILVIIPFEDDDDAVRIANDSPYGLGGGVWTSDREHGLDIARRIRTGMVTVNGADPGSEAPFGGYKASGIGREFGAEDLHSAASDCPRSTLRSNAPEMTITIVPRLLPNRGNLTRLQGPARKI